MQETKCLTDQRVVETVYSRNIGFGGEFVTMKQNIDALRGLNISLGLSFPISSPSYIYGDNMSVVHNTSRPESVLRKRSNSVLQSHSP